MAKLKQILAKPAKGRRYEEPDPTPRTLPVGYKARSGPTLHERIRQQLNQERTLERMRAAGIETPEEANDFEVEDDPSEPLTQHELADFEGTARRLVSEGVVRVGNSPQADPRKAEGEIPVPENQQGIVKGSISKLAKLLAGKSEKELESLLQADDK